VEGICGVEENGTQREKWHAEAQGALRIIEELKKIY